MINPNMIDTNVKLIEIFTDGACSGNPGPGGFGTIITYIKEIGGKPAINETELNLGFRKTTNNRMELLSVIVGLEYIYQNKGFDENTRINVISDSKYVTDAINKGWLKSWVKSDFKGKKNADLWKRYIHLLTLFFFDWDKINFIWVKGHNGHPMNERCDRLAVQASRQQHLLIDEEYEKLVG